MNTVEHFEFSNERTPAYAKIPLLPVACTILGSMHGFRYERAPAYAKAPLRPVASRILGSMHDFRFDRSS